MACKYIYKGHTFNSEIELDDFLLRKGHELYSEYGDLVFQSERAIAACEKLKIAENDAKLYREKYKEARRRYIDGEDELEFEKPFIGVTEFLRGLTNEDDKLLTPEFREEEYWKRRINEWKDETKGFNDDEIELFGKSVVMTDDVSDKELTDYLKQYNEGNKNTNNETLKLIRKMKEKWEAQGEIGTAVHDVLRNLFTTIKKGPHKGELFLDRDEDWLLNLYLPNSNYDKTKLNPKILRDIYNYAKELKTALENKFNSKNLTFFPEFQVATELSHEIPGKGNKVLGIIDLLVIDDNGYSHIVDYKLSPKESFNSAKERTFWYQLGLYNRMINNYGLNQTDKTPKVVICPIRMVDFGLDENGKFKIEGIEKRDNDPIYDITANSTLNEVARNLDQFVPEKFTVNLTPENMLKSLNDFNSQSFPNITTSKTWTDEDIKNLIELNGGIIEENDGYSISFPNMTKGFTGKTQEEVFDKVKEYYTETLPKKRRDTVRSVIIGLRKGIAENTRDIELPKAGGINLKEGALQQWLQDLLGKYCSSDYEILENDAILEYGVMLLRNKITNQIDVILVVTDNLDFVHKFNGSNDRQLITGAFEVDSVQARKPRSLALRATSGNVHLMEVMAVLNCIPDITSKGAKIGEVQVVNPYTLQGTPASNEELLYNFNELVFHILKKGEIEFENNIGNIKFASKVELAENRFKQINELGKREKWEGKYIRFKSLSKLQDELTETIASGDGRATIKKLEKLRTELEKKFKNDLNTTSLDSYNEDDNLARSLYNKVLIAIADAKGIVFRQQTKDNAKWVEDMAIHKNGVQSLMLDNPGNLNNETLNVLTKLVTEAYENVREDMSREVSVLRDLVSELKEHKGFSKFKELTYGNQADLYKRMIKKENGDLLFRNPWEDDSLTSVERKFLKYVLEKINKDRLADVPNIEKLRDSNDVRYFRVPLAVGDMSSRASQMGGLDKAYKARLKRLNPKVWFDDMQKKLTGVFSEGQTSFERDDLFKMNNMFDLGLSDQERLDLIQKNGYEYFETNLETLLLKHLYAYSTLKHVDKIMPMAKAAMIHLVTQGLLTNKKFTNATNYVSDYIKNKIKNQTLIEENMLHAAGVLGEIKSAASFLALGFSPVSYGYQLLAGLWTDIRLWMLNNGETPFTFDNFKFAFSKVYKDMFILGNKVTKCSLLNEMMGINDMDMNVYAEKLKSDRYGIFNIGSIAFHCASRPDFFNRMAMLVAKMKNDGCWDAYSVKGNRLEYDWKKDERFKAYATEDKSDMEAYSKAKGLYLAMAEQLENEHALNQDGSYFKVGDALPKAYTTLEIESFKSQTDDIYGYYSHEKKAMIHATTIGSLWMQMRAYWSGKKNQYLGSQGVKLQGQYVHQKNSDGKLLYYKEGEGGHMEITTDNTGVPVFKWEGKWLEGILLTISKLATDMKDKGFSEAWHDSWYSEDEEFRNLFRANMKQLAYDLTMFGVVGPMCASMMVAWDNDLDKEAKESNDLNDAVVASAAHMACKMVSSSFGDLNFIEAIGGPLTSWLPFSFGYLGQRVTDAYSVVLGDRKFSDALIRMSSVTSNSKRFWKTLANQ